MPTPALSRSPRSGLPRLIALAAMLPVIAFVPAGCAKFLGSQAGTLSGKVTGNAAAKALPAPRADVVTDPQGGPFCPVMTALGFPIYLDEAQIAALSDRNAITIDNTLAHGEQFCGWK